MAMAPEVEWFKQLLCVCVCVCVCLCIFVFKLHRPYVLEHWNLVFASKPLMFLNGHKNVIIWGHSSGNKKLGAEKKKETIINFFNSVY